MMKSIFAAAAVALAVPSLASAADLRMPVKAPAIVVAETFNWTGFYIGAHGGYGWGGPRDFNLSYDGGFGGGQIGYNWHMSPNWVFGIEADISGGSISGTLAGGGASTRIDYFGTVRGRLGYAVNNALIYGTGGFAYANNEVTIGGSSARLHTGWTAGGGVEWGITQNWSAKVEYLYARFGSENYFGGGFASGPADLHTVKFGVNYRFGGGMPIVARY